MPVIPDPPVPQSLSDWIAIVFVLLVAAGAVWLVRSVVPRIVRALDGVAESQRELAVEFRAESKEQRETFSAALREQRAAHEARLNEIVSHCQRNHVRPSTIAARPQESTA